MEFQKLYSSTKLQIIFNKLYVEAEETLSYLILCEFNPQARGNYGNATISI